MQLLDDPCLIDLQRRISQLCSSDSDTEASNVAEGVSNCERFTRDVMGIDINLRKEFDIPPTLPFERPLFVFDQGVSTRTTIDTSLRIQGISTWEKQGSGRCLDQSGSHPSSLVCIENELTPTTVTLGHPSVYRTDTSQYIDIRKYILAFATLYFLRREHLDVHTWTVFPSNSLSDGRLLYACWYENLNQVGISWAYPVVFNNKKYGARRMIPIKRRV